MIEDRALGTLRTATDVDRAVRRIWDGPLDDAGVLHVTACQRRADGSLEPLAIHGDTPVCEHDRFALGVARARADAIVTTGAVLRAEPSLNHVIPGDRVRVDALTAWRRKMLAKRAAPLSLVLTSGRAIDWDHPFLRGPNRTYLFTGEDTAARLRPDALAIGADVIGVTHPSLFEAIRVLRDRGCATISIEAGPSTTATLYREPIVIDEVMLSVVRGHSTGSELSTSVLPPIDRLVPGVSGPYEVVTTDAIWTFTRHRRR